MPRFPSMIVSMCRRYKSVRKSIANTLKIQERCAGPIIFGCLADPDPFERVLVWPEEKQAWVEENRGRERSLAAVVVGALNGSDGAGPYTVLGSPADRLVTGPVSSIRLRGDGEFQGFVAFLQAGDR